MLSDKIFLSLGSNIGKREKNLYDGIKMIKLNNIKILRHSYLYETEPVDYEYQNDFLNIVLNISTEYSPDELLKVIKRIEYLMGRRDSKIPKGPRIMDIDILFYNDIIIKSEELVIPHREVGNRYFVLRMMMDLDPDFIVSGYSQTIKEMFEKIDKSKKVERVPLKLLKGVLS